MCVSKKVPSSNLSGTSLFFRPGHSNSIQASDRLMKEIKSIHKSENYKSGVYQYDLINENLYNWKISLVSIEPRPLYGRVLEMPQKVCGGDILQVMTFE